LITPIEPTTSILIEASVKRTVEEIFADWEGNVVFHEDPITPTIDEWAEV
jgi:hypothetical protein